MLRNVIIIACRKIIISPFPGGVGFDLAITHIEIDTVSLKWLH